MLRPLVEARGQKNPYHPGDLVIEAWNTEKLMRAYAATKKLDKSVETTSSLPIKMHPIEMAKTNK